MKARFQFTIGGLMLATVAVAVDAALMAWAVRAARGNDLSWWFVLSIVAMVNVLGIDGFLLARRARSGRSPFGPAWSQTTFGPQLILVLLCLYVPFAWVLEAEPARHGWVVMGPVLPGFVMIVPFHWLIHQRTILEGPVIALMTTLLIMGLVRLVARGKSPWACGLALLASVPSSLMAHAAYSF